jgi:hypothetical protein
MNRVSQKRMEGPRKEARARFGAVPGQIGISLEISIFSPSSRR